MCHSIKYRYWDRQGLHEELCASSAAALFCTTASLDKGGHRAKRGCELPSNSASATSPSRASPLLPFFTCLFQGTLHSPFPGALLSFYHWVHCFCIWLMLLAVTHYILLWTVCFEMVWVFGKFNSVLNQSRNDLLLSFSMGLGWQRGQWGRIMAIWKIINIGLFLLCETFRKHFFFMPFFF